ncbi:hypothetical protein ADL03_11645 [Nocardia sp. NRRL S-836]|nr:hypothetical protein ADL03_11645 [Nocardia sp. NRRL S-836]
MIAGLLYSCDTSTGNVRDVAFPDEEGSQPAGVGDSTVAALVADKLRQCAAEVVLSPANCPQSGSVAAAHNVRWELVGDPADGMHVVWHKDKFFARGTAVMTLTYDSAIGPGAETKPFHFQTELHWQGSASRVDDIYRPRVTPSTGTISKRRFQLPERDVVDAVRAGFTSCVGSASAPMPAGCPRTASTPSITGATWRLNSDPVTNWRIEEDSTFGIVRLTANYSASLRLRRSTSASAPLYTQDGPYVATLVRTGDSARLLDIRHK